MSEKRARTVFTTNFDSVVERALAEVTGASLTAYHLEGSASAVQAINNEEFPLYVKLHGDFRYDSLKNLPADLATQNEDLARCLTIAGSRFGFIITGYSGRDASVMLALRTVLAGSNPFPHGLFWTGMKGVPVPGSVSSLLADASARSVLAEYVEIETFDALLLRLWRNSQGMNPSLDAKVRKARLSSVDIPIPPAGKREPLIRMNALPLISIPSQCVALSFHAPKTKQEVRAIRDKAKARIILAQSRDGWCWGDEAVIKATFGTDLRAIEPVTLPSDLSAPDNRDLRGFVESAIATALALGKPLAHRDSRRGSFLIANSEAPTRAALSPLSKIVSSVGGKVPGLMTSPADGSAPQQVRWAEALHVSLDVKNGRHWLLIEPDIWIWPEYARRGATNFISGRRRDRFNVKHDALLSAWVRIILGTTDHNAAIAVKTFESGGGIANPSFTIGSRTAYTQGLAP